MQISTLVMKKTLVIQGTKSDRFSWANGRRKRMFSFRILSLDLIGTFKKLENQEIRVMIALQSNNFEG